ncbi:MAG: GNAT family N-acetyltransferase [Acidobacteria bacterium]|nr:GNAT family N-acetyltransferase [Acidobacteriota bacterium]MCA1641399.1 GNAT family N-acetyltransferase [Acidobacteriota bacterium]
MRTALETERLEPPHRGGADEAESFSGVEALARGQESEVLDFLSARPLHNVYMAGFIRDNGLESPHNRGTFYACRDEKGRLEGVALVGHVTQLDARTDAALTAFARAAQACRAAHVIMGEEDVVRAFWDRYAPAGQTPRLACRERLLEQRYPLTARAPVGELRPALPEELPLVAPVQARMAEEECGVDPLSVDPEGFHARCARRIARGRTWVVVEAGRLAFKAEVMAETPETVYVEGVYVEPGARGAGFGRRCLSQLGRALLARSRAICLLVNERNTEALAFYLNAGYKPRGTYDTIYLFKS